MSEPCARMRGLIPRALFDDLDDAGRLELNAHLACCDRCSAEQQAFQHTVAMLRGVDEAPVPRHFFVDAPPTGTRNRRLSGAFWAGALAAAVTVGVVLALWAAGGLHVRVEHGVLLASLGTSPAEQLEAEWSRRVLDAVDRRLLDEDRRFTQRLELALGGVEQRAAALLTQTMGEWTGQVDNQLANRDELLREDTQRAMVALYRTVDDQWRENLWSVNQQLEQVTHHNLLQDERTDAVVTAMFTGDRPAAP